MRDVGCDEVVCLSDRAWTYVDVVLGDASVCRDVDMDDDEIVTVIVSLPRSDENRIWNQAVEPS